MVTHRALTKYQDRSARGLASPPPKSAGDHPLALYLSAIRRAKSRGKLLP